jgi:putative Holliday junction resolvase
MRILGIDYGTKRIGVAISDPDAQFALPHSVIANVVNSSSDEIVSIAELNGVKTIVIGESRNYSGEPNKIMPDILTLKESLEKKGYNVQLELEFMTSQQAERHQGKNEMTDASAAALILQSYIDKKK